MIIAFGCDHAGYSYKERIFEFLHSLGHKVIDCGCFSDISCDYPDFAKPVAVYVSRKICEYGILVCGSGIGMSIAANKFSGIRAALCFTQEIAALSKDHNNANILCLPARFCSVEEAVNWIKIWLETKFADNPRHRRRINKIGKIEKKYSRKVR